MTHPVQHLHDKEMAIQETRAKLFKSFNELGKQQQINKFLFSCISEGLMPKGLRFNFNLAKFVNSQWTQGEIEYNFYQEGSYQIVNLSLL